MRWACRILIGLTAALMLAAAWLALHSLLLMANGTAATGEIVDIRVIPGGGSRSREIHAPIVQFSAGPRIVRGQLSGSADPTYVKGDRVPLYFAIATPERFVVADFDQMWLRPLVVGCIALVTLAASWLVRMAMRGVNEPAIFGLAFQGIGAAMLAAALLVTVAQWLELRRGIHTVGTVTNGKGEPWRLFKSGSYTPLAAEIAFTGANGRQLTAVDPAIDANLEAPNAPVRVFYDPERTQRARVAAFGALWFNSILLAVFGLAATGAGLGVRVVFRT